LLPRAVASVANAATTVRLMTQESERKRRFMPWPPTKPAERNRKIAQICGWTSVRG
jgi:hypothetical protein